MFDLGKRAKVAILSVTEGEDNPLKYPHMFRASELMILNKMVPYVKFDVARCIAYAREVNPFCKVFRHDGRRAACLARLAALAAAGDEGGGVSRVTPEL